MFTSDVQEIDSEGATVKKITPRSDKPDDLVEGLDNNTFIGGHKVWWNSFLDDGQKLNELKAGNKMVLLMDILKESDLIGDKVIPVLPSFPVAVAFFCRFWCSASLCCLWI